MTDKITLVMNRLKDLNNELYSGKGDMRMLKSLIRINEDILNLLTEGRGVYFSKGPDIYQPVFFCLDDK